MTKRTRTRYRRPALRREELGGYPGPGARNAYRCKTCGRYSVLVHLDAGVTPMFLHCLQDGCDGQGVSAMYPPEPWPAGIGEPTHEWYRPGRAEYATLRPAEREHVDLGGLLLRPITQSEKRKTPR